LRGVRAWQQENRERYNARQRSYRNSHRKQAREGHLRRTFGISQKDYADLLARQGGGCAICGRPPKKAALHVDHDHETNAVRGLLCVGCNNALGQFKDSPVLLARASSYLEGDVLTLEAVANLDESARLRAGELCRTPG
jgi:hypothetical protein